MRRPPLFAGGCYEAPSECGDLCDYGLTDMPRDPGPVASAAIVAGATAPRYRSFCIPDRIRGSSAVTA
jgi:hypothetical protein